MKPTKKIIMLRDDKGAPEGHTVFSYAENETYDLPADLADEFVASKSAKFASEIDENVDETDENSENSGNSEENGGDAGETTEQPSTDQNAGNVAEPGKKGGKAQGKP